MTEGISQILDQQRAVLLPGGASTFEFPRHWGPVIPHGDLLVAIPDMHMYVDGDPQDCFRFGAKAMRSFLERLVNVRDELSSRGHRLHLYQLGDLFEFCYPAPGTGRRLTVDEVVGFGDHIAAHG